MPGTPAGGIALPKSKDCASRTAEDNRRVENVVHMHHDSGMQAREDLQVLIEDIAADGDDVARVEKEDIAVAEAVEELQWDLLGRPFDEAGEPGETGA